MLNLVIILALSINTGIWNSEAGMRPALVRPDGLMLLAPRFIIMSQGHIYKLTEYRKFNIRNPKSQIHEKLKVGSIFNRKLLKKA